jgi:hypothetical protein
VKAAPVVVEDLGKVVACLVIITSKEHMADRMWTGMCFGCRDLHPASWACMLAQTANP